MATIGNKISFRTQGRYTDTAAISGSAIPGPKTILILKEITVSYDSSGMPTLADPVTVQSISGVLRPTNAKEKEEWQKMGAIVDYAYYIAPSQFTDETNKAKLLEKNVFTRNTKTYEIVGIEDNTETSRGQHYKVFLQELK